MISAMIATNKLRARFGPRPLVVAGMLLGAGGMLYLTRLGVDLELRHRHPAGAGRCSVSGSGW